MGMEATFWIFRSDRNLSGQLAFFEELEECFVEYAKSEDCFENFGKLVLRNVCRVPEGSKKELYMPLLEKLLSLNIPVDLEDSKSANNFDIYEKLTLLKMGESLKG